MNNFNEKYFINTYYAEQKHFLEDVSTNFDLDSKHLSHPHKLPSNIFVLILLISNLIQSYSSFEQF